MPELPEVETSRRGIAPHIIGQVLTKLTVRNSHMRWPVPVNAIAKLEGDTVQAVERRGKYIKLIFTDAYVMLHLGMSGNLRIVTPDCEVKKHDHIDFAFANNKVLRMNDSRRFGSCLLVEGLENSHKLLDKLGPEPLSDDFTAEYLYRVSRGVKKTVKQWIMDSHLVVGVGNIYAAESLFKAGIRPNKEAGKISKAKLQLLHRHICEILVQAIEQGGTTLKDFVGSDGKPGYFKQQLHVYGREGLPCTVCTDKIKNIKLGQRSTFYCSRCQK